VAHSSCYRSAVHCVFLSIKHLYWCWCKLE